MTTFKEKNHLPEGLFFKFFDTTVEPKKDRNTTQKRKMPFYKTILYFFWQSKTT